MSKERLKVKLVQNAAHAAQRQMQFAEWLKRNDRAALSDRLTFMTAFVNGTKHKASTSDGDIDIPSLAIGMLNTEIVAHSTATPVFVTSNAHDLISEAASLIPPTEMLLASEIGDHSLILWFEKPYQYDLITSTYMGEFSEEHWQVEAIAIERVDSMATTFNDTIGPGLQVMLYGRPTNPDKVDIEVYRRATGGLTMIDCIGIRTGVSWDSFPTAPWVSALKAWVVAMYRLMGDHIEQDRVRPDRAERRRLERLGFPRDGYITELRLRKVAYGNEGEGTGKGAPLRFRHRVRGHWRKFYCPSMGQVGDPEAYRHRYVNDYIRGPKETPMVESQQVITLVK